MCFFNKVFFVEFKVSIFVGNLPFRAEREDVLHCCLFGEVLNCSSLERDTGRKEVSAFVEMADGAIESTAIDGLQGTEPMGRPLRINTSQEVLVDLEEEEEVATVVAITAVAAMVAAITVALWWWYNSGGAVVRQ